MREMKASEALYGFCGWLTTREEITKLGSSCDCAVVADLVKKFCDTNNLSEPEDNWQDLFKHPEK